MKRADLFVSALLAVLSLYLMVKSTELPIGWIKGAGPGGGAFPFWLSVGMLISSLLIFARTLAGWTPESRSTARFITLGAGGHLFAVVLALAGMIGVIHVLGVYVSVPLFLIFYLRILGGHSWPLTLAVSLGTPVATFLLFEKVLVILLPKGITDPLFYIFF